MRIARSTSLDEVALEELADPLPGPGEVVCRVLACGVCGSDVSDGYVAKKLPVVLGHEVVGEVIGTGDGVTTTEHPADQARHGAPGHACTGTADRSRVPDAEPLARPQGQRRDRSPCERRVGGAQSPGHRWLVQQELGGLPSGGGRPEHRAELP